jgi:hypothetical protein
MNTLRDRTKVFARRVIRVFSALPRTDVTRVIGRQMIRVGHFDRCALQRGLP